MAHWFTLRTLTNGDRRLCYTLCLKKGPRHYLLFATFGEWRWIYNRWCRGPFL